MKRRCALCVLVMICLAAAPPQPSGGTLVIVGGGRLPAEVEKTFLTLAGGSAGRLVVIPTASSLADQASEKANFLRRWQRAGLRSVTWLHVRDRKIADRESFVRPLREATAVWLSGGDQSRLTTAYRGTVVEREIKALLERGGVVGGTSAGAAVMSETMITGGRRVATTAPGFGLLQGVVLDQHFLKRDRVQRLLGVLAEVPNQWGVGIDEATAIVVRGQEALVLGDSYVLVTCLTSGIPTMRVYRSGQRFRLTPLTATPTNKPSPGVPLKR